MPKVTIWVRETDYEKWQAIENIPEFISDSLKRKEFSEKIFNNAPLRDGKVIKENEDGSTQIEFTVYQSNDPTYTDPEDVA